jgi:hypothetical protein
VLRSPFVSLAPPKLIQEHESESQNSAGVGQSGLGVSVVIGCADSGVAHFVPLERMHVNERWFVPEKQPREPIMKKQIVWLMLCAALALIGCKKEETAGEALDRGIEKTKEVSKDAADKTGDALKNAGDKVKDATK